MPARDRLRGGGLSFRPRGRERGRAQAEGGRQPPRGRPQRPALRSARGELAELRVRLRRRLRLLEHARPGHARRAGRGRRRAIARWHVNMVRLPLNQDCWLGEDGLPTSASVAGYRAAVRGWVAMLHRPGIVVILDLHWSRARGGAPTGSARWPTTLRRLLALGRPHLQATTASLIFDVFNEPFSRYDGTARLRPDLGRAGATAAARRRVEEPRAPTAAHVHALGMQALVDASARPARRSRSS